MPAGVAGELRPRGGGTAALICVLTLQLALNLMILNGVASW